MDGRGKSFVLVRCCCAAGVREGMNAMRMLYDEQRTTADVFHYQVNEGGELNIRVGGAEKDIEIVFVNGKYDRCKFNFRGPYTRAHWHILKGIADKIAEIEAAFAAQ